MDVTRGLQGMPRNYRTTLSHSQVYPGYPSCSGCANDLGIAMSPGPMLMEVINITVGSPATAFRYIAVAGSPVDTMVSWTG
jgi:hypothetical protein